MHVMTRSGLRGIGGAALAVAVATALVALPGTAYAGETAPSAPVAESPAQPAPAPATPAPVDPAPVDPAPAPPTDPAPADPSSTTPAAPTPAAPTPAAPTPAPPTPAAPAPADGTPDARPSAAGTPGLVVDPASADLSVTIRGTTVAAGSEGKVTQVVVTNDGPAAATDPVLTLTFTPGVAPNTVMLRDEGGFCDATATTDVYRCELGGPLARGATFEFPVTIAPAAGASATPAAGTLRADVTSPTPDPDPADNSATATFAIAAAGSDIVLIAFDADVVPGEPGPLGGLLANFGDRRSGAVAVRFTLPAGVRVPADLAADTGCDVAADGGSLTCLSPAIPPGGGMVFMLPVAVPENAGLDRVFPGGTAVASDAPANPLSATASRRTAAAIFRPATAAQSAAVTGDVDAGDNSDTFVVHTTDQVADVAIEAPAVRAAKGAVVAVTYRVHDDGPATVDGPQVTVTAPAGTEFAGTPEECDISEDGRQLSCFVPATIRAGDTATQTVRLRVTGSTVGTDGRVVLGSTGAYDPDKSDNTARIVVRHPEATLVQGRLPVTGAPVGGLGTAGGLMLLTGTALAVATRRRRTV
jgi:hypothetical protein